MKKSGIIFVALILVAMLVFSACAAQNPPTTSPTDSNTSAANTNQSTVQTPPSQTGPAKPLKVVLLVNNNLGDMSFFDSAASGMEAIKKLGCETKIVETGTDQTKWEPALQDLSDQDWDVIICGTYQMLEPLQKIAPEYPEKKYILFDSAVDYNSGKYANVHSITYRYNEGAYLAGVLAAKVTSSSLPLANPDKVIGFVGGEDVPVINDYLVGYIQGAQYVDPKIKVAISYIGDWNNTAKGKEMALAQFNQNSDILFSVAGQAGLGGLDAAKDAKKYAIGVDSDQALLFKSSDPEKAKLILSSEVSDIGTSLEHAIKNLIDEKITWGTEESVGIKESTVGLIKNEFFNSTLPEDIKTYITDIESKIKSEEIKVNSATGMDKGKLDELRNSVKP